MKRAFTLFLIFALCVFMCLAVHAVETAVYFFEDKYETGLPDEYSGGFWDYENKACLIEGTASATTEMTRSCSISGEKAVLSATFVLSGTQNMQMRFYDGSTLLQQMHLNPGTGAISVRKSPSGYNSILKNASNYQAGIEYTFEIEFNFVKPASSRMRITDNSGNWKDWENIEIVGTMTKIDKWNWIYGGVSTGSSTTIKRMEAWKTENILNDKEAVQYVKETLLLGDLDCISGDMSLPTAGTYSTKISWDSSSANITADGTYTAPTADEEVTLTAHITRGEEKADKEFIFTLRPSDGVRAKNDLAALYVSGLDSVTGDITLPNSGNGGSSITWASSAPDIISANGTVTRPDTDTEVTLTARVESGAYTLQKEFYATVKARSTYPEKSGTKTTEHNTFGAGLPTGFTVTGGGAENGALVLKADTISLQKAFDPQPGHRAYIEMTFAMQGESDKLMQLQLFGSTDEGKSVEILSAQLRIDKGLMQKNDSGDYEALTSKVRAADKTLPAGKEQTVRWEVDTYSHTVDTYLGGDLVKEGQKTDDKAVDISKLVISGGAQSRAVGMVILSVDAGFTEDYRAMAECDAAALDIPLSLTENVTVSNKGAKYGSDIVWSSSDSKSARYDGENKRFVITRPAADASDAAVVLTATLTNNGVKKTKTFNVTIPREKTTDEILTAAVNALTEAYVKNLNESLGDVSTDLKMPTQWEGGTTVSWTSSDESVIDTAGKVERRFFDGESKTITLTANISKNGESRTKTFIATVKNTGYDNLLSGKTITASTTRDKSLPTYAADESTSTVWKPHTGDTEPYAQADLGTATLMNRAKVSLTGDAKATLLVSQNGTHWETAAAEFDGEAIFTPVKARYVRIALSGNNPERGIAEAAVSTLYNDELCVYLDAEKISFSNKTNVTGNITLPNITPEYKSTVTWTSGNTGVLSNTGAVTRPAADTTVALTATVSKGNAQKVLTYSIGITGTGNSGGSGGGGGSSVGNKKPTSGGTLPATPAETTLPTASGSIYKDLSSDHWAGEAVRALCERGVISGYGDNTFRPDRAVSRAEFAKMVYTAFSLSPGSASFTDINEDDWYKECIYSLYAAGIVQGFENGAFYPNKEISRRDMAVMLDRAAKSVGITLPQGKSVTFADEYLFGDYAAESIARFAAAGIVNGTGNELFSPDDTATRAQAAKVIYELLKCGGDL